MKEQTNLSEKIDQIISDTENDLSDSQRELLVKKNQQLRVEPTAKRRLELLQDILKIILLVEQILHHIPWT